MWPIIKKELRENAHYLLAAFAIALFFLDCTVFDCGWILLGVQRLLTSQSTPLNAYSADAGFDYRLSGTCSSICLILAGAIALGQVYQERRRKTWPLLAHLPMPRSRMICAKVLAGLLIYLIICLPMALLVIARLNTRGVWPGPIYAKTFLSMLGPFLAGAMFYLAAFLSAFRPARWYATKWLPLIAALPAYLVVENATAFFSEPFYHWQRLMPYFFVYTWLVSLAAALLSLPLVLWSIREQARTREY